MRFRRMPIEAESPEEIGYERIRCNLAESSVSDLPLGELGSEGLDKLLLAYGDHRGHRGLRELVAADGPGTRPDDVLITPGASAALFLIASALLQPGDEVIVARPNYATNVEAPRALGAAVRYLELRYEDGWQVDPGRLAGLVTARTRLVSLTSPHNPTGTCLDEATLREVIRICERHGARLLFDETYREMAYAPPLPVAASLSERAISVASLSKTYGLPGLRIGWLVTRDRALAEMLLAAKELLLITGSIVDEELAFRALSRRASWLPHIRARIAAAFATTRSWLQAQEVFEWVEPAGGVVAFPRLREPAAYDVARFYAVLNGELGTLVGPGHWFEQPDHAFRLGYGWPAPPELAAGLANLSRAASAARR
jgi:aspartate/methionine/tyrosine aminotransferase